MRKKWKPHPLAVMDVSWEDVQKESVRFLERVRMTMEGRHEKVGAATVEEFFATCSRRCGRGRDLRALRYTLGIDDPECEEEWTESIQWLKVKWEEVGLGFADEGPVPPELAEEFVELCRGPIAVTVPIAAPREPLWGEVRDCGTTTVNSRTSVDDQTHVLSPLPYDAPSSTEHREQELEEFLATLAPTADSLSKLATEVNARIADRTSGHIAQELENVAGWAVSADGVSATDLRDGFAACWRVCCTIRPLPTDPGRSQRKIEQLYVDVLGVLVAMLMRSEGRGGFSFDSRRVLAAVTDHDGSTELGQVAVSHVRLPIVPLHLDVGRLLASEDARFLLGCLSADRHGDLVTAIRCQALANLTTVPEAAVVFAATTLEALFGTSGKAWLSTCGARLVPKGVRRSWKELGRLCDLRNGIVHDGIRVGPDDDVDEKLALVGDVVWAAVQAAKQEGRTIKDITVERILGVSLEGACGSGATAL